MTRIGSDGEDKVQAFPSLSLSIRVIPSIRVIRGSDNPLRALRVSV